MKVREAALNDLDDVAMLFDQYRRFYKKETDLPLARKFIGERIKNKESIIFVAENEGGGLLVLRSYIQPSRRSRQSVLIYLTIYLSQKITGKMGWQRP